MLIGFFALPVYLPAFGKEFYGIFLLAFELPQILGFLDLGAAKSILRFTSQYRVEKNISKYQAAISVNVTLAIITSLIVAVIIIILGISSSHIYHLNADEYKVAFRLFTVSAFCTFFIFLDFIPLNILFGSNIFHDRNKMQLISVFYALLLVLAVKFLKISLESFSILFALGFVITFLLDLWLVRRKKILNGISLKMAGFSEIFRSGFLRYNMNLFGLSLIAVFSSQSDKQIIGIVVNVEAVTIYVVITKVYYIAKGLLSNFYSVLKPTLAVATNFPVDYMQKLFLITTQSIAFVLAIFSVYIFFLWPFLSNIWMHSNDYIFFSPYVSLSIINLALSSLAGMFISYFSLSDEAFLVVKADFFTVLINLILSILFCIKYGAIGAIMGTTAQMLLNAIWYIYLGGKKKLINYTSYFSISFLLLLLVIIFDYLIIFNFSLSLSIQILICIITTVVGLFHFYRLGLYSVIFKKILL